MVEFTQEDSEGISTFYGAHEEEIFRKAINEKYTPIPLSREVRRGKIFIKFKKRKKILEKIFDFLK